MEQDTSTSESQVEVNFDGLRNAISPINLMFDGRLYQDVKGLTAHITQAMKMVKRERPDYQGALVEINLLEAAFNSAIMRWEQKLTGEIQRLKSTVETAQQKSLGATKKISKYKEELTRGRASTRSMPIRIGQVRNQLIHVSGNSPRSSSLGMAKKTKSRLVEGTDKFPTVYKNAVAQVLRKVEQRGSAKFMETALKVFKNVSKPMFELQREQEIHRCKLYYLQQSNADNDPKSQFVVVRGINEAGGAYSLQSIFLDTQQTFEIEFEDLDRRNVFVFEPLEDMEIILQLLRAKFKGSDFKETFNLYAAIRRKAIENQRDEKFNPRQLEIHQYLTDLVFEFVGISFDNRAAEVRFTEHINAAIQIR
ncbi:MAG: hypothetical protein IT422_14655 [Pirellulaceae bacterium]|nr:hypothetical protein [Pirellulaceae bacterium]